MWSSGRCGGGDDPERKRCVTSDAARKRAAKWYTNYGLLVPDSLLRRETEEYDLRHARRSAAGSSSGARSTSGTGLLPVKRERESGDLPAVKIEPGKERPRGRGVIGPDADAFEVALTERTAREQHEEDARRRRDDELSDLLFKQALAADRELHEKLAAWRRDQEEHDKKFIDLVSFDSDDGE